MEHRLGGVPAPAETNVSAMPLICGSRETRNKREIQPREIQPRKANAGRWSYGRLHPTRIRTVIAKRLDEGSRVRREMRGVYCLLLDVPAHRLLVDGRLADHTLHDASGAGDGSLRTGVDSGEQYGPRSRAWRGIAFYVEHVTTTRQDTDPAIAQLFDARYARMSPTDKLRRVRQLTLAVARLALAGRRMREPRSDEAEHLRELARQRLGSETFARVYGDASEPHWPRRAS